MGKGTILGLALIGAILILSLLALALLFQNTDILLDLNQPNEKENEENEIIPVASYTNFEAKISNWNFANDITEMTYWLIAVELNNNGDFDLSLTNYETSLINWVRPVGSKDSVDIGRNFVFELEYDNRASSTLLNETSSFTLELIFSHNNGTLQLNLDQNDFLFE